MLDTYIQWFKSHERFLLVVVGGLILWFAIGKIDTLIRNHDDAGLQQAKVVAAVQAEKNAETLALVQQQAADLKTLNDKVLAQQAQLEQANVAMAQALIVQKKSDAILTPTQLTDRWNYLVPGASASVSNGQVTLPQTGAVATVQKLEEVPVLTKQLDATQTELNGERQIASAQATQIGTLNVLIAGKDASLKDADKVCKEQIKVTKDEARRAKRRWGVIGAVVGFVTRQYIKSATGL